MLTATEGKATEIMTSCWRGLSKSV